MLQTLQYQVLTIIDRLGRAYGAEIDAELARMGCHISAGALYTTLSRLQEKGYTTSAWSKPTPVRGGRRRRYYAMRPAGFKVLAKTRDFYAALAP